MPTQMRCPHCRSYLEFVQGPDHYIDETQFFAHYKGDYRCPICERYWWSTAVLYPEDENTYMRDGWGLMLGRYQPWHEGHQAIFEQILKLHPAGVCILVRDSYGTSEKNPLRPGQVVERIEAALEKAGTCAYLYEIIVVPDIQGVYYGRDVGYAIEKIELPPEFTNVSATQKRKEQGLTC